MLQKFAEYLAFLLIGSLALIIPIFALTISILARAIESGRKSLKQEGTRIVEDIQQVQKRAGEDPEIAIKELKTTLRKYSWNRAKINFRRFLLSTRASLYYPGLLFLVSLTLVIPVVHLAPGDPDIAMRLFILALTLTGGGVALLLGVLESVHTYASVFEPETNPFAAELQVHFLDQSHIAVWPVGSEQIFTTALLNSGDYLAETIEVGVFFPEGFTCSKAQGLRLVPQGAGAYEGYTAVFWDLPLLHTKSRWSLDPFTVTVPKQKGEYMLPVRIKAAKIRMVEGQLKVVIV